MINAKVIHDSYGEGIITNFIDNKITVQFLDKQAKFIFPDAFRDYLSTDSNELMEFVERAFAEKEKDTLFKTMIAIEKIKKEDRKPRSKKYELSNIAFKCNYCDGGQTAANIGFKHVCSDALIVYNIEQAHHVWCSSSNSPCKKYLDGEITRSELESLMFNTDYNSSVCYESKMLRDWRASAGVTQTGVNKGKPMRLLKVQANSLAILTTRDPYASEDERYIFAVFLVDENYEGDGRTEGYVTTRSKWKIQLTTQEANRILFWTYYSNEREPAAIKFSSGLHRYLSDEQAAQILRDIAGVKRNPADKEFAQQFFAHFCRVNGLDANSISKPAGALVRMT